MKRLNPLAKALMRIESEKEMIEFLQGILTLKEQKELPTRLDIVKMLKAGVPQHVIAEKLGVGVSTVTRGSKEIQLGRFKKI
jgi:TrpR family trp operon transcriptional repressor